MLKEFGELIHQRLRVHEFRQMAKEGTVCIDQGIEIHGMYFLLSGELQSFVGKEDRSEGIIRVHKPGDCIIDLYDYDPDSPPTQIAFQRTGIKRFFHFSNTCKSFLASSG